VLPQGSTSDKSTKEDAQIILESYLDDDLTEEGGGYIPFLKETPKEQKYFENVDNILLVSNKVALEAMQTKAEELGYETMVESVELQGEARELGKNFIKQTAPSKILSDLGRGNYSAS